MAITDAELEAITHGIVDAIMLRMKREFADVFKRLEALEKGAGTSAGKSVPLSERLKG